LSSADEKGPLILEFDEFQRKLEAAARLTRSDLEREEKRIFDLAFSVRLTRAANAEAEKSHVLSVPDAEDPQSRKSITGGTQRERLDGALWYYLEALLARMRPHIQKRFKPAAEIARRSSSAELLSSNLLFQAQVHIAQTYITTDRIGSRVRSLCGLWGRPDLTASFDQSFRLLFAEEWERLVCEAELEAPPSLPPTPTVHGDARSRALASEFKSAAAEEESAEDRRRREVICEAVKLNKQGLEYCKYLDANGLRPSPRLQASGCPSTYAEGYKKFKKSFWKEKTRVVNESVKRSRTTPTIH